MEGCLCKPAHGMGTICMTLWVIAFGSFGEKTETFRSIRSSFFLQKLSDRGVCFTSNFLFEKHDFSYCHS